MKQLREFVDSCLGIYIGAMVRALDGLTVCFHGAFGDGLVSPSGDANEHIVLAWLYRISTQDGFENCLHWKEPLALLIFACSTPLPGSETTGT